MPYAYDSELGWRAVGLIKGEEYFFRCRAALGPQGFGPWTPTIPPSVVVDQCVAAALALFLCFLLLLSPLSILSLVSSFRCLSSLLLQS